MRLKIISLITACAFIILGSCLFWAQIVKGGYYYNLSQNNRIRLVPQEAARGNIYDTNNGLLADNVLSYDLVIMPQEFVSRKERSDTLKKLSVILDMSYSGIEAVYKRNYNAPFTDIVILKNISKDLIFEIEQMRFDLPAVSVKPRPHRRYVLGPATAHILGYLGEIDQEQLTRLTQYGYRRQDSIGKNGIEKILDMFLRGEDGGMQIEVNNKNFQVGVLSSKPAKSGRDVKLTIDARLQEYAYKLLDSRKGAVVLMDPSDGRVFSLVSSPGFIADDITPALNDKTKPLLNRALQSQCPPGSIFKIITATAGLDTGKISAEKPIFFCPGFYTLGGRRFNCWDKDGHGWVNMKEALKHSCNVFFFNAGQVIKIEPIIAYARLFGLGRATGIELPGETAGFIPDKNWKRRVQSESWREGDTLNFSIGQGSILITPIQAAVMVSVIANRGKLAQPYVVESIGNALIKRQPPKKLQISEYALNIVRDAMESIVQSAGGTGIMARVPELNVSGKTGTAQVSGKMSHAWFVGFTPSDNPKAAIAVFLENGGYGGESAAPIAAAMFKKMKELELL